MLVKFLPEISRVFKRQNTPPIFTALGVDADPLSLEEDRRPNGGRIIDTATLQKRHTTEEEEEVRLSLVELD